MNIQTKTRFNLMKSYLSNLNDKIILDMGVGETAISNNLNAKKIITLDGFKHLNPDIICDINNEAIPLKMESVDVVIAGELIEHMKSPVQFLKKINKILKVNGDLILSTPNIASLKNRFRLFFGLMPEHCCRSHLEGLEDFQSHVKDFNYPHLREILKKTGFEVINIKTNGIIFHSKRIFPLKLTPPTFGENLVIHCKKITHKKD